MVKHIHYFGECNKYLAFGEKDVILGYKRDNINKVK